MDVAIVILPLIGAIVAGFFGRWIGDKGSQAVTCGAMLASMVLAIVAFVDVTFNGNVRVTELFAWFDSGDFDASWSIRVDQLTAVMLIVVTIVSTIVHIYSIGYMHHDHSIPRFMAYLSLFTF